MLLEVRNATVHYHKVAALRGVSMDVPHGSVVTIIGANGAGKSTLLRAISGLETLSEGKIRFDGSRIDGTLPEKVVAQASSRYVIVVDESKLVERLGERVALPVEVVPFAVAPVRATLERRGYRPAVRMAERKQGPVVTDNGNLLIDAWPPADLDPARAERELAADGGAQITGSHNPPEWNGIKMTVGGRPLYGERIQELRRRIDEGVARRRPGTLENIDVLDRYVADVAGRFKGVPSLKVVVDCANASGALTAVPVLEAIGADVIPLYCELDGTFPNHHPDPTVDENIVDLAAQVRRTGAALGSSPK